MTGTLLTLIMVVLAGSQSFRVREAASKRLEVLSEVAPGVILAGETHADPEIRKRCKTVMDKWYARHAAELVDALEPAIGWPWCDSLTLSCTDQNGTLLELEWCRDGWNLADRTRFLAEAQHCEWRKKDDGSDWYGPTKQYAHPWNAWREATRLWMIELIAQRRDVAYFLRCLCEGHLQQCRYYGYEPRHGLVEKVGEPEEALEK
jgi:hypothetical protein